MNYFVPEGVVFDESSGVPAGESAGVAAAQI